MQINTHYGRIVASALAMTLVIGSIASAEKVVENYDDGKKKIEYMTNAEGVKHGPFREFHPTGRTKRQGRYVNGQLSGPIVEFNEQGRKEGETIWAEGVLLYPRSRSKIISGVREIMRSRIDGPGDRASKEALKQLMIYRYLCEVPHEGMVLDEEYNKHAEAAAAVCRAMDRLDHHPKANPGVPEDVWKYGKEGCAKSNLSLGRAEPSAAVDGFMDDSDRSNIDRVGHRRWCLNPAMRKTGFGQVGRFAAMYAFDKSRTDIPDWDFVAYPARGLMPTTHFGANYAWSVSLNPRKYAEPSKGEIKVKVWAVRSPAFVLDRLTAGTPLELDYFNVENSMFGLQHTIIFRPKSLTPRARARYFVEIEGVKRLDGDTKPVRYMVEFM